MPPVDSPVRSLRLGITLGDPTGIGPEVVLRALQAIGPTPGCQYVLVGDPYVVEAQSRALGFPIPPVKAEIAASEEAFCWNWRLRESLGSGILEVGGAPAARAAIAALRQAATACQNGELDGLVTGPVNKESVIRAGIPFVGQTEFLTELAGNPSTAMMLLGQDDRGRWLRVLLATTHLPLKTVASKLTFAGLQQSLLLAQQACRQLGLPRSRIAVCGLNPHAGEGGTMGTEENEVIRPAVEWARESGIDVVGPAAADTLFHRVYRGDFEVVLAMYHDQGLVPLKMVAFDSGVNWTVGLPFVRTSPDHGTAYDIAGKGIANPSSMVAAIRMAQQLMAEKAREIVIAPREREATLSI